MTRKRRLIVITTLILLTVAVIVYAQLIPEGVTVERLRVDGRLRRYLVHVPDERPPKGGYPVVFVLHGGGGAAPQIARHLMIHQHKTGKDFVVVYPESTAVKLKRNWNDGRTATQPGRESLAEVDDVKYIHAVLDKVEQAHRTDKRHVFAVGISNGAFMSQKLAAESARFAAIGPVVGSMAESVAENFKPPNNVSVMIINGVDDPLVPYEGGMVGFGKRELGKALPIEKVAQKWATHNGCLPEPKIEKLPNVDPNDGTRVTRITYAKGRGETEVQLLKIDGGGHNWPGTKQYAREALIGKTSRDIDASEELLQFFLRHPMR